MLEYIKCSRCGDDFEPGEKGSRAHVCAKCTRELSRLQYKKSHPIVDKESPSKQCICSSCGILFDKNCTGSEGCRCPECVRAKNRNRYHKNKNNPVAKVARVCSVCGEEFINGEDGSRRGICPNCASSKRKEYFISHKDIIHTRNKEYSEKNRDKIRERKHEYYCTNAEKNAAYRAEYYNANRKVIYEKYNKYRMERLHSDIEFKIRNDIASDIRKRIHRQMAKKNNKTIDLLGCSIRQFMKHIEDNWEDGMSWDNYGNGKNKWSFDHRIPCASFNLLLPDEQKKCFNWSNVFPMWSIDNNKKKDKLPDGTLGRYLRKSK